MMRLPSGRVAPTSAWHAVRATLRHDTLVHLYLAVVAAEALIYSVPLMDPGTLTVFGASPFQIPFLATVTFAAFLGLRRLPAGDERDYWTHLAYAVLFWMTALVWVAFVPEEEWTTTHEVWLGALYLLFYSPILLAVERKPHIPRLARPRETERQLRWAGVTLLVVGYFVYFVAVPVAVRPDAVRFHLSSSLLFLTVDTAIILRYGWRAYSCRSSRWRVLYGTMVAAGVALLATDIIEALTSAELLTLPEGTLVDMVWAIAPFFFLLGFRLREADLPREPDLRREADAGHRALEAGRALDPIRVGSFLVAGAMSFPLVHFALHTLLHFEEALLHAQQAVVLAAMVTLTTLAAVAYRVLSRERRAEERARAALDDRLREAHKLEAVSRLAGVVATRFAPALESLALSIDRAFDALTSGDPLRDQMGSAHEQVQRLTVVTRNLAAVSRLRRGRPERVELADAVADTIDALRGALGPSVRIESSPTPGCAVEIDPSHLRTILLDLATNARDAMPGGGRFRIEVGRRTLDAETALSMTVRPGRFVQLTVRDSGCGIPHDARPHLFEPFFSTKPADDRNPASGLGLATLYAVVSQHGGCVTVTSEAGKGTAFEILLPAA